MINHYMGVASHRSFPGGIYCNACEAQSVEFEAIRCVIRAMPEGASSKKRSGGCRNVREGKLNHCTQ